MKIDLDWIKKELAAGREVELECVDELGFLSNHKNPNKELLRSGLIVRGVESDAIYINKCSFGVFAEEFKHFRIKRPAPTFNDLIDAVVKATKDKVINIDFMSDAALEFHKRGYPHYKYGFESADDIKEAIEVIKSLYTETFVIEGEIDIKRIKVDADVKLANGMTAKCTSSQSADSDKTIRLNCNSADDIFGIFVLKGATVTQQKGNK